MTTGPDISPEAVERIHAAIVAFTKQRTNAMQTAAPMLFEDAADLGIMLRTLRSALTASEKQAARMRWIESHAVRLASPHMNGAHEYHVTMAFHKLRGPSLAAAIDAAMEKANG